MNWGFLVYCLILAIGIGIDMERWGVERTVTETPSPFKTFSGAAISLLLILWAMHWKI